MSEIKFDGELKLNSKGQTSMLIFYYKGKDLLRISASETGAMPNFFQSRPTSTFGKKSDRICFLTCKPEDLDNLFRKYSAELKPLSGRIGAPTDLMTLEKIKSWLRIHEGFNVSSNEICNAIEDLNIQYENFYFKAYIKFEDVQKLRKYLEDKRKNKT